MGDHNGILLEDIDHKLAAILEGQQAMAHMPRQLDEIDSRLRNVETDVRAIKAVLKDHSRDISELKQTII